MALTAINNTPKLAECDPMTFIAALLNAAQLWLENYWANTSSHYLVRKALESADRDFWKDFEKMITGEAVRFGA